MFTISDFQAAQKTFAENHEEQKIYSPEKNLLSYELSNLRNYHRGTMVEIMVADRLLRSGTECKHIGGKGNPDIEIYSNGQILRAEVKSATLVSGRTYEFSGVDPDELDNLFLGFIHPTRGLVTRTVAKPHLMRWLQVGGKWGQPIKWSSQKDGYSIKFDKDMINSGNIITAEWNGGPWS